MKSARNYTAPYTATSFKDYLAESSLTLTTCWKLVSATNVKVGATSHTRDITLSGHAGVTFKSSQGVVPTAADTELGLGSAGLEVDSVFSVDVLTEETVAAGDWDGAYFEVFLINYETPAMGELVMFAGTIGEVKTYGERFRAEGRPLSSKATQQIGSIYTEKCTVRRLGDARCKLNIAEGQNAADGGVITTTGTVTTGGSNTQFTASALGQVTGYFTHGTVTFTSGTLNGRSSEIINHIGTPPQTGGSVVRWGSDSSWKMNPSLQTNWHTTAYNDSSWAAAVEQGVVGTAPWLSQVANFPTDSTAQWLWQFFSPNTTDATGLSTYFRKTFTPNVSGATLVITADDSYDLYVNGTLIDSQSGWTLAHSYTITLTPNVLNSIAVKVTNTALSTSYSNPAGLLVDITFNAYTPPPSGGGAVVQLAMPMPRNIDVGTTFTITRGCDREWRTCKNVFGNLLNFRGFPFVPGIEKAYKINR